jgi:hypothetical protein
MPTSTPAIDSRADSEDNSCRVVWAASVWEVAMPKPTHIKVHSNPLHGQQNVHHGAGVLLFRERRKDYCSKEMEFKSRMSSAQNRYNT